MPATLDPTEAQLVAALARGTVARTAPGELTLFPITSAAYFRDPDGAAAKPGSRGGQMLGFGAEAAMAMAPIALAVGREVAKWLLGAIRDSLKDEGSAAVDRAVKRVVGRLVPGASPKEPPDAAPAVSLSPIQFAELRRRALEKARQLGLPATKAEQMADAMVATLATAGA